MQCVWDMECHWKEFLVIVAAWKVLMSCKKSGFVTLRHNKSRGSTAEILEEVNSDVKVEPPLQPLSRAGIKGNQSDKARSVISATGF